MCQGARSARSASPSGARFEQRILWQGEALDRLLDQDHAKIVDEVVRWLRGEGWIVLAEVTFSIRGERGSIDVLACHEPSGTLLVVEVKSTLPDLQGMLSGLDRKTRLAPTIAREQGWTVRATAKLLVLPGDSVTRRRVDLHAATLDAVVPARTVAVRRWAHDPSGSLAGILFLPRPERGQARHRVVAARG